jgi:hypothetical protein
MDDGSEAEFGPGDVGSIPPVHDAWVVGNEPLMSIDFGDALYAKQQSESSQCDSRRHNIIPSAKPTIYLQSTAAHVQNTRGISKGHQTNSGFSAQRTWF